MSFISKKFEAFVKEEDGVALTEYLVLLGLLVAALLTAVAAFGDAIATTFGEWTTFVGGLGPDT